MKAARVGADCVRLDVGGAVLCVRGLAFEKGGARFDVWTGKSENNRRVRARVLEASGGKLHERIWADHCVVVVGVKHA